MAFKVKELTGVSCPAKTTGGGGGTPATGPTILDPTAAGQIPVSEAKPGGGFQYAPKADPLAGITSSDAGKALFVNGNGDAFVAVDAVKDDNALRSLLDQTGVLGYPSLTFTAPNILKVPALKLVFEGIAAATPGTNPIVSVPATDVTITRSGTGNAVDDFTYVSVTPQGTFIQSDKMPTGQDRTTNVLLAEVFHPNGGPIKSVRPLYAFYGNNQAVSQAIGLIVGLVDRGFAFEYTQATGAVSQRGHDARLIGYNIEASGSDRNTKNFPVGDITTEYFSFNPADRVPALTNFNKVYNLDNPTAGTSSPLTGFGIVLLFAGVDGSYFALAPQKDYATEEEALIQRTNYAGSVVVPKGLLDFYVAVATMVVSPTVTTTTGTFDVAAIGDAALVGGSSVPSTATLPDPTTGNPGDVVVVNAAGNNYELKASAVPDLTSAADGSFLGVQGSQVVSVTPSTANIDFFLKRQDMQFVILELDSSWTITGTGGTTGVFAINSFVKPALVAGAPVYSFTLQKPLNQDIAYLGGFAYSLGTTKKAWSPIAPEQPLEDGSWVFVDNGIDPAAPLFLVFFFLNF